MIKNVCEACGAVRQGKKAARLCAACRYKELAKSHKKGATKFEVSCLQGLAHYWVLKEGERRGICKNCGRVKTWRAVDVEGRSERAFNSSL